MEKAGAWLSALVWMGVIFFMSAMPGDVSGEQSGRLVQLVLSAAAFLFGEDAAAGVSADTIHLLVRKGAHMAEYAILFLLYRRALIKSGARRPGVTALCLCACYAATDEVHQAFVADRGPSAADVALDTLGAALAWGACGAVKRMTGKGKQA
ncbi:MAG: VanZ family protein [Candidatus Ventricola sp.]